jgi:hypothetical protein
MRTHSQYDPQVSHEPRDSGRDQLLANSVTLPTESSEEFLKLLQKFRVSLQPVGFLQERVVETITVTDWYRRRYWELGMAKVAHATILQEHAGDHFTNDLNKEIPSAHTAIAVSDNQRTMDFFRRCDSSYSREYRRARLELKELQAERKQKEAEAQFFENIEAGLATDDFISLEEFEKFAKQTEPNQPVPPAESPVTNDTITDIDSPTVVDIPGEPRLERSGVSQSQPTPSAEPAGSATALDAGHRAPGAFSKNSSNQTEPDTPGEPRLQRSGVSQPQPTPSAEPVGSAPARNAGDLVAGAFSKNSSNQTEPNTPGEPRLERSGVSQPQPTPSAEPVGSAPARNAGDPVAGAFSKNSSNQTEPDTPGEPRLERSGVSQPQPTPSAEPAGSAPPVTPAILSPVPFQEIHQIKPNPDQAPIRESFDIAAS